MKSLLYMVCLLSAALFINACSHSDSGEAQASGDLSQSALHDQFGHVVHLTDHPGKWLIVNYWAPWCTACKEELPEINQFYLTHRDQVLIYGFDYDRLNSAALIRLSKKMGIDFPLLAEDPRSQLSIKEEIQALPMTFIYNPDGQLVHILQGPQTVEQLHLMTTG